MSLTAAILIGICSGTALALIGYGVGYLRAARLLRKEHSAAAIEWMRSAREGELAIERLTAELAGCRQFIRESFGEVAFEEEEDANELH